MAIQETATDTKHVVHLLDQMSSVGAACGVLSETGVARLRSKLVAAAPHVVPVLVSGRVFDPAGAEARAAVDDVVADEQQEHREHYRYEAAYLLGLLVGAELQRMIGGGAPLKGR